MLKYLPSPRIGFGLLSAGCAGAMKFALFAQYHLGLEPCPMCILQRLAVIATGLLALAACMHNPGRTGYRIWAILSATTLAAGFGVAARQVWMQHLPADQVPACGPGLEYMMETMPMWNVLSKILSGSGECASIDWTLLGFTLPQLSAAFFLGATLWLVALVAPSRSSVPKRCAA
ncbi:disulfide bond formation protein B [Rhodobacteraceae bacterium CH30]|nr:disulfide bond formation protein B [Rhodobacteraceae bacterium CH30]